MNLQTYNDKILHAETVRASRSEKSATVNLLKHLHEVNRRKLFADYNHSTLAKYIVAELGYSENEAWTRIQAMRLLRTVPEIEKKIESGQLSLSNASTLQGYIQDQGIQKEPEKIAEAVKKAEELTNRKLKEEFRPKETKVLKITLSPKLQAKLKKLQQSWGEESEAAIFEALVDEKLKQLELKIDIQKMACMEGKRKPKLNLKLKPSPTQTRYIPISVRREVFGRSRNQCEHKTKEGIRCAERRHLQYDHIHPYSLNGGRTTDNIRMLCFAHNQRRSLQTFGKTRLGNEKTASTQLSNFSNPWMSVSVSISLSFATNSGTRIFWDSSM